MRSTESVPCLGNRIQVEELLCHFLVRLLALHEIMIVNWLNIANCNLQIV